MALVNTSAAQTLQKGISVEMAVTANATPMPEADDANAWIVAVARDGSIYFGTEKVTPEGLAEAMKSRPRNREQKLYIKADARAPFAEVQRILQAGRAVGFDAPVLLTSQPEQPAPGAIVPPRGLEVPVRVPSSTEAIVVQISVSSRPSPRLTVNGADVSDAALAGMLRRMLQSRSEKIVVLKAEGQLPFVQVAHVIDLCRGAGAKAAVAGPEL
jgi:biopolymer transport protein ExbD